MPVVLSKRNIGSVSRHWRPKTRGFQSQRRMRSFRDTSRSSRTRSSSSNNDVIFFRSYRDGPGSGEINPVYVDLRTEALMRGMG